MTSTPEPGHDVDPEATPVEPSEETSADASAEPTAVGAPGEPEETPVDERLLSAHDLARAALREITPEATIGDPAGYTLEDGGVVSLRFYNRLAGYPNWFWTVSVAVVEGAEPTVLEVELLPGEGALLAPEWVPWAERLAEYQAAQAALAESEGDDPDGDDDLAGDDGADDDLGDDDLDEDDELDDAADFNEDGSRTLHAGDLDGVDIDELDESSAEVVEAESDEDDDETGDDDDDDESDDDDDDDESDDDDDDSDEDDDDDESDDDEVDDDESDDDDE